MGQISFQQNGASLLSFQVDESGAYQLISGDDSWFDPDYVVTRGDTQITRSSDPAAWAQGLKEDYAASGIEVVSAGFPEVALAEERSDFDDVFQEEEVLSEEEIYQAETRLGQDIQKSERKKKIIKAIIVTLIILGLLAFGWSKIFRETGPPAGVFLTKSSSSLFQGLAKGQGSFEFKATIDGEGKVGTTDVEEISALGYKGSFQPGKIKLIPVLEPLPEGEIYTDQNLENINVREAKEIIWIGSSMYIKTKEGWIASKLGNEYNLLASFKSIENALPKNNKKGSPQPVNQDAAEILKVRQTFSGPEMDGQPTWELDSALSANSVESAGNSLINSKKLVQDMNLQVISEQVSFRPRVVELTLDGAPADWIPALADLTSIKSFTFTTRFDFDWSPPEPIKAPTKNVTFVSPQRIAELTNPDTTALTGLTPKIINESFQKAAQAEAANQTDAPGSANNALEDAKNLAP